MSRRITLLFLSLVVWVAPSASVANAKPAPDPDVVRARMTAGLAAIYQEKTSRTAAERKIDSQLLYASRQRRGVAAVPGLPTLRSRVAWDARGLTPVDLRGEITPGLLAAIEALGGEVVDAQPAYAAARVRLPEPAIGALSQRADVWKLRPADRYVLRKDDTSEGDVAHRADDLRLLEGVDGTGVTVAVLSDGVDTLAARQSSGDLPAVTVLPGEAGSGDEGTAMLEIVHDLAPGASLLFATATTSFFSFANNVLALEAAGADVIVDDIGYLGEGVFQDDFVADAIDAVSAAGVLYVSAAGNDGRANAGNAGVWEGDFVDSGVDYTSGMYTGDMHAWAGADVYNTIVEDGPAFALKWSDPLSGSANDYDLLLFDPLGFFVIASTNPQSGGFLDEPLEIIGSDVEDDTDYQLVVVNYLGIAAPRMLHVHSFGGELEHATSGSIYGHPGARGAVAAAAVDYFFAGGAGGEFDGSEDVEPFSSDGPRRVFYESDGTPITPGSLTSTGGELRSKPDLSGADGVSVAAPGFTPFFGTSAAAPHLAGLAALLIEHGSASAEDVRMAMEDSALDIEAAGFDRDSGHGIVEVVAASALLPEPGVTAMAFAGTLLLGRLGRRRR